MGLQNTVEIFSTGRSVRFVSQSLSLINCRTLKILRAKEISAIALNLMMGMNV